MSFTICLTVNSFIEAESNFFPFGASDHYNSLKFEKLMNSDDRAVLTKLALFMKMKFTKFIE